ncbi:MAG: outer membrane lipoprotein-sorting protein, partial [Deltaproteobacteria bacterium]
WIRKNGYVPLREELYNEKGEIVKLLTFSDIRTVSGREVPMEMVMKNLKKDKYQTMIKYHVLDFNPAIKKDTFSLGKLKRLRK